MGGVSSWINGGENSPAIPPKPPQSAWALVLTLVPTLLIAFILFTIFLFLRRSNHRYYAPRTYLGSLVEFERSPTLPNGLFNWFRAFNKVPNACALRQQSLDPFLFLRFLRVCFLICLVGVCITWPILLPINATGGGGQTQLELLSYSNIDVTTSSGLHRLYAHTLVAWLYLGFILYMIMRESIYYINLRQAFYLEPQNANRISSRTVLFTSVPSPYLDPARIRKLFGACVRHIWITYDFEKVELLVEERDKAAMLLEKGEVKLLKAVNEARFKSIKKGIEPSANTNPSHPSRDYETGAAADRTLSCRWIPDSSRPTHRLGLLGLFGKKVDTIDWCRAELERLIPEVDSAQESYRAGKYAEVPAVFVEFNSQSEAQAAFQTVTHHHVLHMIPRQMGITPSDVVWKSLRIPWWQLIVRSYAVSAFIAALIIFWAIPVAIIGVIGRLPTLEKVPGLTWLASIPSPILGLLSGLLPSVLLSILMSLVPIIMRACARLAGEVSHSSVELYTQQAYFIFQLIQVFLVQTSANAAAGLIVQLAANPGSIFQTVASVIPAASNFYVSYFILQGFTIASSVISQVVGFAIFSLMYKFLAGTPRAMYRRWTTLSAIQWGSILPVYANIAVISITYSIIAPIVLFWATTALGLFYLAYRYNVLFVTDTQVDTRGLIYPRALKHLLVGVYLAEICLIGLFSISKAFGPLVLMVAFLVFTILFNVSLAKALNPLLHNLPLSLLSEEESSTTNLRGPGGIDPDHTYQQEHENSKQVTASSAPDTNQALIGSERRNRGSLLSRFLKPWRYADYQTLRELVPRGGEKMSQYTDEVEQASFFPPCTIEPLPTLWIPEDAAGVSKEEITHTSAVIPITDEGCTLDDKNHLIWDTERARPPIWDEKIFY